MTDTADSGKGRSRRPSASGLVPKWVLLTLLLASVAGASLTVWFFAEHRRIGREATAERFERTRQLVSQVATELGEQMQGAVRTATALARELDAGPLDQPSFVDRLSEGLTDDPTLFSLGVAYEPSAPSAPRVAPYSVRRADGIEHHATIGSDYTQFEQRWYGDRFLSGAGWSEPYFNETSGEVVAEYAVPFYRQGADRDVDDPAGIVHAAYSSLGLRRSINSRGLNTNGYAFVISREGRFVVHPLEELARTEQTIFELAWEHDHPTLHQMAVQAVKNNDGWVDDVDPESGQASWIFHNEIPGVGWSLGVVLFKQGDAEGDPPRHRLMALVMSSVVTLLLLIVWGTARLQSGERAAWTGVAATSVVLMSGVGAIWWVSANYPQSESLDVVNTVDPASLGDFLYDYSAQSAAAGVEPPVYIPTGVFVQSIEFISSTNVEVTGYVWQKYAHDAPENLQRGFVFPEAIDVNVTEAFDYEGDGVDVVGWYFTTTLRQNFSYERYPFDNQEVWLRIWHKDFDRNVVLAPDLDAYPITDPSALPGVERDFVLPGWSLLTSGFEYHLRSYNTNFGIADYIGQNEFPELYFSVQMRRQFLGPFVSKLTPLFVVAGMLFALLLLASRHKQRSSMFGFSAMDVVLGCAALFFVLIFDHAALREDLSSPNVMYLEYFYFGLYLDILFVTANSIAFITTKWVLVRARDNLIPKLFFWPSYLAAMLLVTLVEFY